MPYHRFAELIGLKGIYRRPARTTSGRRGSEALAADRPVVLEVKTDPEVPPLPPHITFAAGDATNARCCSRATLEEGGVIKGTARAGA